MLCNSCNSKSICKHYDLVINSHDVIMNITECKYYSHKTSIEETFVKTLEKEHRKELNDSFDFRSTGVNESLFKTTGVLIIMYLLLQLKYLKLLVVNVVNR